MSVKIGTVSRCLVCGGKIIAIKHPSIISLNAGLWVHKSALRRGLSLHQVIPPKRIR